MKQKSIQLFLLLLLVKTTPLYSIPSDCEVLKHITRCEVKDNKLVVVDTIVIQINNRNGEKYSEIEIPYSKMARVSDIEGWIEDSSGKIVRKLKSSDITNRSQAPESAMYSDDFEKVFQLKHNTYPYKICCTYKLTQVQFISIADWSPVIYSKVLTRSADLYVVLPKNYSVKRFIRGAILVKADTSGVNFNSYHFSSSYNKVYRNQLFSESFENIKPKVVVVPTEFFYGVKGRSDCWMEYGNWFLSLNKGLLGLPESETKIVDELLNGISDPKERIKRLYYYLQDHTRYINVTIGVGGFKSYPASYVSENKYGDCKALTNYMMALLDHVGIKSYYTLIISSFQPEKVIEELPFPQFNHIILCVPLDSDTLWLENTSSTEPFGYVSSSIQNRKALLVDESKSRLIRISSMKANDVSVGRKICVAFKVTGDGDVRIDFSFRGYQFEQYNQLKTYYNQKDQDEIVRDLMPFTSYDVLSWELHKLDRDSSRIVMNSRLNVYKFIKPLGTEYYINLISILGYSFERPTERNSVLQIPYPINKIDTIIYSLPDEFQVKKLPEQVSITSRFGNYELTTRQEGNSIYIFKKLLIYPSMYSLEQYSAFYEFIKLVKEAEKKVIVLSRNPLN